MDLPVTFLPSADTYVNAGSTTTNYGSSTTYASGYLSRQPRLPALQPVRLLGTTISKVLLRLYANNADSSGIRAWAVSDNTWGELTMNYTNAPALGTQIASSGPFAAVGWVSLDITSYITGDGTFSIGVTNLSSTAISVDSRESGVNAPQLVVTYSWFAQPHLHAHSHPTPPRLHNDSHTHIYLYSTPTNALPPHPPFPPTTPLLAW